MNILVVDDMADIRRIICTTLERRLECYTVEADSVGDALDAMHRVGPFDLVITDVLMPDLCGSALVRRLRAHEETRETPVLVISVDAGREETVRGLLREGANAFLEKPFTMEALVEKVRTLLKGGASGQHVPAVCARRAELSAPA
jgi:two-component system chemotaxis response regulator CheY